MSVNFFKTDILNQYIGEYLILKYNDNNVYDNFLLDTFIKETDEQPYTGQLFLKYKFNDICMYTITSEHIKEIYVYDNFDYNMKKLLIQIGYKNNIDKFIIHYIYLFLINGKIRLY